jgi:hypothetical protein
VTRTYEKVLPKAEILPRLSMAACVCVCVCMRVYVGGCLGPSGWIDMQVCVGCELVATPRSSSMAPAAADGGVPARTKPLRAKNSQLSVEAPTASRYTPPHTHAHNEYTFNLAETSMRHGLDYSFSLRIIFFSMVNRRHVSHMPCASQTDRRARHSYISIASSPLHRPT